MFALGGAGVFSARYAAYQMTSLLVSYSLCGLAWLADGEDVWSKRIDRIALGAAIILAKFAFREKSRPCREFRLSRQNSAVSWSLCTVRAATESVAAARTDKQIRPCQMLRRSSGGSPFLAAS
jgi:hypothetical protein